MDRITIHCQQLRYKQLLRQEEFEMFLRILLYTIADIASKILLNGFPVLVKLDVKLEEKQNLVT